MAFRPRVLSPACIPVPPRARGPLGRGCNGTGRLLKPLPLLLGYEGVVASEGLEPSFQASKAWLLPERLAAEDGRLERQGVTLAPASNGAPPPRRVHPPISVLLENEPRRAAGAPREMPARKDRGRVRPRDVAAGARSAPREDRVVVLVRRDPEHPGPLVHVRARPGPGGLAAPDTGVVATEMSEMGAHPVRLEEGADPLGERDLGVLDRHAPEGTRARSLLRRAGLRPSGASHSRFAAALDEVAEEGGHDPQHLAAPHCLRGRPGPRPVLLPGGDAT